MVDPTEEEKELKHLMNALDPPKIPYFPYWVVPKLLDSVFKSSPLLAYLRDSGVTDLGGAIQPSFSWKKK